MSLLVLLFTPSWAQTVRHVPWEMSLDAAIAEAKAANVAAPEDFVILLAPSDTDGTHTTSGILALNDKLTIRAMIPGTALLSVDAGPHLFELQANAALVLEDLEVACSPSPLTRLANLTGANAALTVRRTRVRDCSSATSGGVIRATGVNAVVRIEAASFDAADAPSGGHVYSSSGQVFIDRSRFASGQATSSGGSVYVIGDDLDIVASRFVGGGATLQGGQVYTNVPTTVVDCHFEGSTAIDGGGLFSASPALTVERSVFCGGTATEGGGFNWTPTTNANLTVTSTVLLNNLATGTDQAAGGGIHFFATGGGDQDVLIRDAAFVGNTSAGGGGALGSNLSSTDVIQIADSVIAYNTSAGATVVESTSGGQATAGLSGVRRHANVHTAFDVNFSDSGPTTGDPGFPSPVGSCSPLEVRGAQGVPGPFETGELVDSDSDGFIGAEDCDDGEPSVHLFASEGSTCDGLDNDCDGWIDDGVPGSLTVYPDRDGDGYGDADEPRLVCALPASGFTLDGSDCDDTDPAIHPDAVEVCGNAVDEDCSGAADVAQDWYPDLDGDGAGDPSGVPTPSCAPVPQAATNTDDCDDQDASVYLGAPEICDGLDQDCDLAVDEGLALVQQFEDRDGDGFGTMPVSACVGTAGLVANQDDCDDEDALISPDGVERCDGADNDCDTLVDESDAVDATPWYFDGDADGFGSPTNVQQACQAPAGHVALGTDCDDQNPSIQPDAVDVCDTVDNDCDTVADNDPTQFTTWYDDGDGDGFGVDTASTSACFAPPETVDQAGDCDDGDPDTYPGASELCDHLDNDCDNEVDEGAVDVDWYPDGDDDGFGAGTPVSSCAPVPGHSRFAGDCDDADPTRSPGAAEICDGIDQDCNNAIDDGLQQSWYADVDQDGYGDPNDVVSDCAAPLGRVPQAFDCDDGDATINPAGTEACDGVDNDCDQLVDEGFSTMAFGPDADQDGFAAVGGVIAACVAPPGFVPAADPLDCDDGDASVFPGATEVCDGVDSNCDGQVDTEFPLLDAWPDADGDGFGDAAAPLAVCELASGQVDNGDDCDDTDAAVSPAAAEVCGNGIDEDCSGADAACEDDLKRVVDAGCTCSSTDWTGARIWALLRRR